MKDRLPKENLVDPYDPARVKEGAYQLAVGSEAFITSHASNGKQNLGPRDTVIIPPGQFGLVLTEEVVTIPSNAIGFISIRAKIKFKGLVNVSGFHVDPGFSGFLKFSVYNAGSQEIRLSRGDPHFLIWFSSLDGPTRDLYNDGQPVDNRITSDDETRLQGHIASPGSLKTLIDELRTDHDRRLKEIDDRISTVKTIVIGFGVSLAVGLALLHLKQDPSKPSVLYLEDHRTLSPVRTDDNKPTREGSSQPAADKRDSSTKPPTSTQDASTADDGNAAVQRSKSIPAARTTDQVKPAGSRSGSPVIAPSGTQDERRQK